MDDMESKLNAILGNEEMMQKIMSMAQALNQSASEPKKPSQPDAVKLSPPAQPSAPPAFGMDFASLQKIAGLAQNSGIDSNQKALLRALQPYLSRDRIQKMERAMRAAKLASAAGFAFGGQQGR